MQKLEPLPAVEYIIIHNPMANINMLGVQAIYPFGDYA